ncbi:MAG TPA: hypothetical protein VK668_09505 [Mucilaginibacter sp.]|nr:hypothetical protein [Mucilaginibacter sp.]
MKKIVLTRSSVSMGDDAFDHTVVIDINEEWTILQIMAKIMAINYLPKIQGGKATWSLAYHEPLAVIAQEWDTPYLLCPDTYPYPNEKYYINIEKLNFNYHAQLDPTLVSDVLKDFRPVSY